MFEGKKFILVTGSRGYIGSVVVRYLMNMGYAVLGVDNQSNALPGDSVADRDYPWTLGKDGPNIFLEDHIKNVDGVVHLAAATKIEVGEYDLQWMSQNNTMATIGVIENVIKKLETELPRKIPLVFASTSAVYADENAPSTEDSAIAPVNWYGWEKLHCEQLIRHTDCHAVILRFFNAAGTVYGISENRAFEDHLIPAIRYSLDTGEPFILFGDDYDTDDGSCVRDFVHVLDIARAIEKALAYLSLGNESDTFNVGTGRLHTVWQVVQMAAQAAKKDIEVQVGERRAGDMAYRCCDNEKIKKVLGWEPMKTMEDILGELFSEE